MHLHPYTYLYIEIHAHINVLLEHFPGVRNPAAGQPFLQPQGYNVCAMLLLAGVRYPAARQPLLQRGDRRRGRRGMRARRARASLAHRLAAR